MMTAVNGQKSRSALKLLLIQIREDQRTRDEEHQSFARYSGLKPDQIDILNVFDTPSFPDHVVDGYDAVYVGGSSAASVLEPDTYPFVPEIQRLLLHCIRERLPVFCSCFGHQLAILALGGRIIRDESGFEMGTIPIELTDAGKVDPLFSSVDPGFRAVSVHRERATELPPGCTLLAYTDSCTHAFKVHDAPFWTAQFHPEVDLETMIARLTIYASKYTDGDDHLREVIDQAVPTPQSNHLLGVFVDRILLGQGLSESEQIAQQGIQRDGVHSIHADRTD